MQSQCRPAHRHRLDDNRHHSLLDGRPQTQGASDTERLLAGELVYTGVERSPICGIPCLHYRKQLCPVARSIRNLVGCVSRSPVSPEEPTT
jgi:hypothetical protein